MIPQRPGPPGRSVKATLSRRGFDVASMYDADEVLAAMKDGLRKDWQPPQPDAGSEGEGEAEMDT